MENKAEEKKKISKLKVALRLFNIAFCFVFVSAVLLYVNLGKVVNYFADIENIKEIVNKNTNLVLEADNPVIQTTKDFSLNLSTKKITLKEPDNGASIFETDNAKVGIKIFPLLFKKIEFREISASNLKVNIERYKDGSFNFQKYIKKDSKFPLTFVAKNALVLLDEYLITYKDNSVMLNAQIAGKDLISTEFNLNSVADIKTEGELKFSKGGKTQVSPYAIDAKLKFPLNKNLDFKDYRLQASVKNLDFSYFYPYVSELVSKDMKALRGKGSLVILPKEGAGLSKNPLEFKLDMQDVFLNIRKNGHDNFVDIKGKSTLDLTTSFQKNEIFIDNLRFLKTSFEKNGTLPADSNNIDISAYGVLKNISDLKNLNPDITFEIRNSSLSDMLKIAPDYLIKMQQDYIPNLKKYNAHANVNAKFQIKDRFRYPNMYGYIKLDDVYLIERPKGVQTSSGDCTFKGEKVYINVDANLPPAGQKLTVKGETEIKELPFAKFDIQSSKGVDIEFAHRILIPIHKIFGFQLGPLPFMTVGGNGEISLKTEGTRESAKLNGCFRTKNGTAALRGLNTKLFNGNLNLLFKDKKIIFDNTTGIVEGAKIKIDGSSDVTGNLDLYVNIFDVNAQKALGVVKTSDMVLALLNGGKFLDAYTNPKGNIDFKMRLWGKVSPVSEEDFTDFSKMEPSDDLKAKGTITFKNNDIDVFPEIKASKVTGTLDFTDYVTMNLNADVYSSPFNMKGTVTPDTKASKKRSEQPQIVDLTFSSKDAKSKDLFRFFYDNQEGFQAKNKITPELYEILNKINFKFAANVRAKGKVNPDDTMIDMKKFTLEGWATGMNYNGSDVLFNSGEVKFKDQKIIFKNLNKTIWGANIVTNGETDKIFDDYFIPNLSFKLVSLPFSKVFELAGGADDKNIQKILADFSEFKGNLNGDFQYNKEGFFGHTNLNNISLYDKKRELPIFLNSGDLKFSNSQMKLNALNMSYGHTPVYLDAILNNFNTQKPDFNVYVSTNLNEESLDKLLNPMLQYPLKTKGEFTLKGRLRGKPDDYSVFSSIVLNPGTDLYYMGASLGDIANKREINSRINFKNDEISIKNINYLKFILSQNNKQTPYEMLKLSGNVKTRDNKLFLENLKFYTPNPAPARLLNIAFKKSILKQGTFTADMLLSGPVFEPKARGNVNFSNVDMPLYHSQIRDIDLILDEKLIKAVFDGTGFGSDVKIVTEIVNKPTLPVIVNSAEISSQTIDLNAFINGLSQFARAQKSTDPTAKQAILISPTDFEVKKGSFKANEIQYNNVKAQNFSGNFRHTKEGVFIFNDIVFDIAGGKVRTDGSYEFDTTRFTINSEIKDCDANTLVTDILGTKNQIFGKTNGKISLTGRELNTAGGINTVKANVDFAIYDGKMPKLGSLEYLLRAGNLVKSGIMGFTINNIIEVLIPYKTGEFKKISGDFIVENGKVDKMNIYSKGENLSIYTSGNYDIATNVGDFEVLGKLSTKISNLLGPVGNASVNSLVNFVTNNKFGKDSKEDLVQNVEKIPDISNSTGDFRLFAVKILGDLNADSFVKSFNWLN